MAAQADSLVVLGFDAYMDQVRAYHPIARQARLQTGFGEASLLQARGGFDPKAFAEVSQKDFEGTRYYSRLDGGLKLPTVLGLEFEGGYERNQGEFLDPENRTPDDGLWYAGLSIPLAQGLLIDRRRAELRKARQFLQMTLEEQRIMLNDLLLQAGRAYFDWYKAYRARQIYDEGLRLARQRYGALRQQAALGERPLIDTLEAGIQVQDRMLLFRQAELELLNAEAALSLYLWDEQEMPLQLAEQTVPDLQSDLSSDGLPFDPMKLDSLSQTHPEYRRSMLDLGRMEVDRKLIRDQLKPELEFKYRLISEPAGDLSLGDYTWGLNFNMPLFLRKERGKIRMTELKIEQARLKLRADQAKLLFFAETSLNDLQVSARQVELYDQTVRDYGRLLEGERRLFESGESSLFLVNAREMSYIQAQVKLLGLAVQVSKARLKLDHALGLLPDDS